MERGLEDNVIPVIVTPISRMDEPKIAQHQRLLSKTLSRSRWLFHMALGENTLSII
jgi:hypothetical protein